MDLKDSRNTGSSFHWPASQLRFVRFVSTEFECKTRFCFIVVLIQVKIKDGSVLTLLLNFQKLFKVKIKYVNVRNFEGL